jgi:sucrose-6-phosphate hydrolase SacC (GH32 family)
MVHRTARSQILGDDSALHVYRSTDGGATFADVATLPAITGRDLRDPAFYVAGDTLMIKALTRLPVDSSRDSGVHSQTVLASSKDGVTWSAFESAAPETYSFWRPKEHAGTYYAGAYEDGDASLTLFTSPDGRAWTKGATIYDVAADTPLEPELVFMPSGKLLAFFRMDGTDAELLGSEGRLRTGVCWADAPYTKFDCPASHVLSPYRLDGPVSFFWQSRLFVVARKHLQDTTGRKRTALFELTGDFAGGPLAIKEWGELPSAGDTAYAGVAMLDDHRALLHWYAGDLERDEAWVLAMFNITDIWRATLDLSKLGP